MSPNGPSLPLAIRVLVIAVLALGVLGFGAIGLCGGWFTLGAAIASLTSGPEAASFLILSLPCLIGGVAMVVVCVRRIQRLAKRSPAQER